MFNERYGDFWSHVGFALVDALLVAVIAAFFVLAALLVRACATVTAATLDTTGPTFVVFLLGVIVIVGGLIYLPMLIWGPIGERIVG